MPIHITSLRELQASHEAWQAPILVVHVAEDAGDLMALAEALLACDPAAIAMVGTAAEQLRDHIEEEIFFSETSGEADFVPDPHITVHITTEELRHFLHHTLRHKYPNREVVCYGADVNLELFGF